MANEWTDWTPRERAVIVRQHAQMRIVKMVPGLTVKQLSELFGITEEQVEAVLGGADFPESASDSSSIPDKSDGQ